MRRMKLLSPYSSERASLRERIRTLLKNEMREKELDLESLAEQIKEKLDLGGSCKYYLSNVRTGKAPGYSTDCGRGVPFKRTEWERLSVILYYFDVPKNDELIGFLRNEGYFFYPPPPNNVHSPRRRSK